MFPEKLKTWFCTLMICAAMPMAVFSQAISLDSIPSATVPGTKTPKRFVPHKFDYGIQVGSQFSSSSYGTGFSTFISPHLTYGLSKRFSISGGVSIVNTTLNGYCYNPFTGEGNSVSGNYTTALVYLSGQYILNDRLTISGSAYKQFNLFGEMPGYNSFGSNDAQGIYMNVRYKILENFHIEAGFGYSKGYSPYNSVFNNDPFNRTFGDPFFHQGR